MPTADNRSHHRGGLWAVTAVLGAAIIWGLWWWPLRTVAHAGLGDFGASIAVYLAGIAVLLPLVPWRATPFRHGGAALIFSAVVFGFALAAWNMCGFGGAPSFALFPEKMLTHDSQAFAIGQLKSVMAFIVLGWLFTALGFFMAARAARHDS